ncbi:MAG: class I SAM-dependent methyltransferase [Stellaceae bacterium]
MAVADTPRFAFGKNWQSFIDKHFSEERVAIAQQHLLGFLKLDTLAGKRMIDIGCGSGLHSLAALRSDVLELLSFDYDMNSVAATQKLRQLSGNPAHWRVEQGSVLDNAYLESLGQFDIVYSWGVLHHTGDQWSAIRNAAGLTAPGGMFYVALYTSDVFVNRPAEFWLNVKRRYNRSGWLGKRMIEAWYIGGHCWTMLRCKENPLTFMWNYKKSRGMSYYTDVRDWVGGWPMEFSAIQEVKDFARDKLKLELVNIKTGEANTEYLFQRATA